ncbi:MAG: AAA family ATPase [Candidatus Paceibacterota bacterium]
MTLKRLEINGFKSFGRKATLIFDAPITAIVGPNGSGKSNVAEAFRWVLGEQSLKSLRGKKGEDLIFNGSSSLGRLNRANVSVTFDNSRRIFANLDFEEINIMREVFRDGTNEYSINGSKVRLKDILELLAGISLGSSGNHIISQGEADRILNSNPIERRMMIEDALGLKIYQWKLEESEKKLTKTKENIKEAEILRREIAPHLKFLKKQMEKVEKAKELRTELSTLYLEYLKREEIYLTRTRDLIKNELISPQEVLSKIESKLTTWNDKQISGGDCLIEEKNKLREIESVLREGHLKKDNLSRRLGRLEGMIELKQKENRLATPTRDSFVVSSDDLNKLRMEIEEEWQKAEIENDPTILKKFLNNIKLALNSFFEKFKMNKSESTDNSTLVGELMSEKQEVERALVELEVLEQNQQEEYQKAKILLEQKEKRTHEEERESYELRAQKGELTTKIKILEGKLKTLAVEEENFKRELGEAGILIGRGALNYENYPLNEEVILAEERGIQEERHRKLERLKIRLEDMGGEGADVEKEYEEVLMRDGYLEKELADLTLSAGSLEKVMIELKQRITEEFKAGIKKINSEFQKFFEILFGGGAASLALVMPEKRHLRALDLINEDEQVASEEIEGLKETTEEGIEIIVNLPRKKIKGLAMLSGGERALTSIALLFAMSQVNPPPFMILDETDAALDEANSRKYGDMIENLSKFSQLILITHNRETMSRAGVLYGVTMGSDSVSRLISLKLTEAEQYAK